MYVYISGGSILMLNVGFLDSAKFSNGLNIRQEYSNEIYLALILRTKIANFNWFLVLIAEVFIVLQDAQMNSSI